LESKGSKDNSDLSKCGGHNTDKFGGYEENGSSQMYM
jgi:hypothetical protein